MSDKNKYMLARKETKTYISKVFSYHSKENEKLRNVCIVFDDTDSQMLGEIEGALCLRINGNVRKTQVMAVVSQDDKKIKRLSIQTLKTRKPDIYQLQPDEFTFRENEFQRLVDFLERIKFIDFSNENNFQIEDISSNSGNKTIIDASDKNLIQKITNLPKDDRDKLLYSLQQSLSHEDINILLGRKQGLASFERELKQAQWSEAQWQDFFEKQQWVFGYGLDYRIMRQFDREMTVGSGGTSNKDKPKIDFLNSFKDYTVLVEIKLPNTPIFKNIKGARAGTWSFSHEFIGAVSQIIEQKARWAVYSQGLNHYNSEGKALETRTRNAKAILVIGSSKEFDSSQNERDRDLKRDTFELFRRENRTIDIITYDELLERAQFITKNS